MWSQQRSMLSGAYHTPSFSRIYSTADVTIVNSALAYNIISHDTMLVQQLPSTSTYMFVQHALEIGYKRVPHILGSML